MGLNSHRGCKICIAEIIHSSYYHTRAKLKLSLMLTGAHMYTILMGGMRKARRGVGEVYAIQSCRELVNTHDKVALSRRYYYICDILLPVD